MTVVVVTLLHGLQLPDKGQFDNQQTGRGLFRALWHF